jgi:energy-coupling factor transporter ATP-binding protein EcfA2
MAVIQYKRAEHQGRPGTEPYAAKRAEWYRCSEGLTIGSRILQEGEIMHISEMDIDVPDPQNPGMLMKAESFQPLSLPEQERRFGRIMYTPYQPTEDELQELGWTRDNVVAEDAESNEQLLDQHQEDFLAEIEQMPSQRLRQEGAMRYGLTFPDGMSANRMRGILKAYYTDEDGELDKNRVTDQMKANLAQRVGVGIEDPATNLVENAVLQDLQVEEDTDHESKVARRRAKAAKKVREAEATEEEHNG